MTRQPSLNRANGMLPPLANCPVLPNVGEDRGSRRVSTAPGG
jgi:hypothetical protein